MGRTCFFYPAPSSRVGGGDSNNSGDVQEISEGTNGDGGGTGQKQQANGDGRREDGVNAGRSNIELIWHYAGWLGMDPKPMTLRELVWAVEGKTGTVVDLVTAFMGGKKKQRGKQKMSMELMCQRMGI